MKTIKKANTIIFSLAFVLVCNAQVWAQSGRERSPLTSAEQQKYPAAAALKNFKADPAYPELSQKQLSLLRAKAELEAGMANNSLSQEQISSLTRRIGLLEPQVKEAAAASQKSTAVTEREQRMKAASQSANASAVLSSKQATRAQFTSLDAAGQKAAILNNVNITDLVNATPADLSNRQDNIFYIPVADFKGYDIEKQIHILNNPSNYIVVENASVIPVNNTRQQDPAINTYKISRSELNSFSPERRKAIENSKNIVITD